MANASDTAVAGRDGVAQAEDRSMSAFDYAAEAEFFPARRRNSGRLPFGYNNSGRLTFGYKRFARSADAIRFAIEELSPGLLVGAYLEINEERFDGTDIRRLYDSPRYPLARRVTSR